jgi:hypothetical protein
MSTQRSLPYLIRRAGIGGTFVQRQNDIGAELRLDLHYPCRGQDDLRAIQVRSESYTIIVYNAHLSQAEDLESTTIGQNGTRPAHKAMEAAEPGYQLRAGSQEQMVRV